MNKETYYFSHDYNARSDPKIKRLIAKHGMQGYGIYWGIVEDLYNNANALPTQYDVIAFDMRCEEKAVKSIINDFGLFVVDGETFGSPSVGRRLDERDKRSASARESANARWEKEKGVSKRNANAMQPHSGRNAKGKERKGNKSNDDIAEIISFFNAKNKNMPVFKAKTDGRVKAVRARIQEYGKDAVDDVILKASTSTFLNGGNDKEWRADFDWIMRPTNFVKVMEGNYDNRNGQEKKERPFMNFE